MDGSWVNAVAGVIFIWVVLGLSWCAQKFFSNWPDE